nr:MAG TPA: hypothetical protein [Caudoviricetes sp.]
MQQVGVRSDSGRSILQTNRVARSFIWFSSRNALHTKCQEDGCQKA